MPLIQGFEDAGDFTVSERLKTSVHVNLVFYLIVGSIGLFGIILLIMMHRSWLVLIFVALFILLPYDVGIVLALHIVAAWSFSLCHQDCCFSVTSYSFLNVNDTHDN